MMAPSANKTLIAKKRAETRLLLVETTDKSTWLGLLLKNV